METLSEKINNKLRKECILYNEAQVLDYLMKSKEQILNHHYTEVCRLYTPGEGGQSKYYSTKLEPKNRSNQHKIYAKTQDALDEQIIAFYLKIESEKKITIRKVLLMAVNEQTKTGKRTIQRFDKHFSSLSNIKVSELKEEQLKKALDNLASQRITSKEFNESITCLNKIASYCSYEHIDIIDIKQIIGAFRKIKLCGKHCFNDGTKQTKNLAFTKTETSRIIRDAINNPTYKSLSVAILVLTGLRAGELLALELDDIYLEDGYLWIHHIEDTKTFEILDYVKENKSREVYLSQDALDIINYTISYRKSDTSDSPYLLLNANSKDGKMHLRAIDNHLRTHIHHDVLGYGEEREARSSHDCRRTYASLEYLNGTDIYTIKNQLGHSKITQTEEYIKDIIEASERRNRLKGMGILYDIECRRTVDAFIAK